jgi:L-arabinose isomerase
MWIATLKTFNKPFARLHTQFNRELPWPTIDMDFINLNQSARRDCDLFYGEQNAPELEP